MMLALLIAGTAGCGSSDDGTIATTDAPTVTVSPGADAASPVATATPAATDAAPTATPKPTANSGGVSTDTGDGSPSSSSGGASADGVPPCTSGVLAASLDFTTGGGAAGSTTGNLVLRNTSNAACSLQGYPGVSFVDGNGNQLGAAAARSAGTARAVTVHAGDSAFAQLKITDALNYDASTCGVTDATGLRIYPPGEKAALFVNHAAKACTKNAQVLTVGPMSTD